MQSELSHHPQTQMAKIQPKKNQKQNRNTLMLLPSVAGVLYLTREFVAHMLLINTEYRLHYSGILTDTLA